MSASVTVVAGGDPGPAALAALTASAIALVEAEAAPAADPTPAPYRSRWRRAALLELAEVPVGLKDEVVPWKAG